MRFTGQFVGAKLDLQKFKTRFEEHLVQELHRAVKVWLQVVAGSGGRVPLWSGMARASLLELSQLIDGRVILSPLKAKSRIAQGQQLGTAVQTIDNFRIIIEIETDVPHYSLQEYRKASHGGSPTAPWQSRAAGLVAFRQALETLTLLKPMIKAIKIKAI